jgi:hypothetical protein
VVVAVAVVAAVVAAVAVVCVWMVRVMNLLIVACPSPSLRKNQKNPRLMCDSHFMSLFIKLYSKFIKTP